MNENLDLTKILDGCPKGTKFYSSIYGEVRFERIVKNVSYPIILSIRDDIHITINVTKKGLHYKDYKGECLLFPSKDQRDWAKFDRFWDKPNLEKFDPKTLQPFDKVIIKDVESCWVAAIFSHMDDSIHGAICCGDFGEQCIPYNEETKHLIGTTDDCPEFYKWWEE